LYEDLAEIALANLDASDLVDGDNDATLTSQCASTLVTTGEPHCGDVWKHPFHIPTATQLSATKRSFDTASLTSDHQIEKNSSEFPASTMGQCASTLVTTGEPQRGDVWKHPFPAPSATQRPATCTIAAANSSSSKRQRLDDRKIYAVDIGAGSATFCIEFLEANPNGFALAIDIVEPVVFWSRIPDHLLSRLQYHQAETTDWLDKEILEAYLSMYFPDVVYSNVTVIHFSPECQTLSEAGNTGARDKYSLDWTHPHRVFNGTTFAPTSDKAREDDRVRADVLLNCLRPWAAEHPEVCITVENPWHGLLLNMPDVQELLETKSTSAHTEWRVARVDYCKLRDEAVDPPTSQKPTVFITYGYDYVNVQCYPGNRCNLMLSDGVHHQYCIRNNPGQPAEQVRLEDPLLRSRIPRGVHRHFHSKRSQPDRSQSESVTASIESVEKHIGEMQCEAVDEICDMEEDDILICELESTSSAQAAESSDSKSTSAKTSQKSDSDIKVKAQRKKCMPMAMAKLYHAKAAHCGRKRLYRFLRAIGLLKYWLLPNHIECDACDIAKAKQAPHCGTLVPAQYPNEIIHVDLMNMKIADVHGNLHSMTIVDGKSRKKTVYPMRAKSDSTKALQKYFGFIRVPPTEIRVDAGGEFCGESATGLIDICRTMCIKLTVVPPHEHQAHGIVERAHQTLLRQAHAMLLSSGLPLTYWSYALRYAAYVDQFLSSHDGLPEPYSFWHPDMPTNPSFHAFGAPLIYRQQEPNLQRKLDPKGHRARYLGPAEQHGCVYVLDLDIASTPTRITNNVLRRTYREPLVVDIAAGLVIDPEMLNFDLVCKTDGNTGIEHVLAEYKPIPVPPEELERARQHQEFCATRAQQLHDQGVAAFEANTTILRELHRDALRKAHRSDAPAINTDPILQPTADAPPTEEPIAKKTTVKSNLTKAEKQQLCHNPDIVCVECGSGDIDSKYSSFRNRSERVQILICDCCDQGYHSSCLGLKWQPRAADGWYCPSCLVPGTEIEVQRTGKQKSRYDKATVVTLTDEYGLTEVQYENSTDHDKLDLRRHRWRLQHVRWSTVVADINEVEALINNTVVPKSMQHIERIADPRCRQLWLDAAYKEMDGLCFETKMFDIVKDIPEGDKHITVLPTMLLFKYKPPKSAGEEGICKCRCVCLGNRLDPSSGMPAPTPRMPTFRMMLSLAAHQNWHILATDCTQAFGNAKPLNVHYVRLPKGFPDRPYNGALARLMQNLYGLSTAPYAWFTLFTNFMITIGFKQNAIDPCLYQRQEADGTITYVLNYVDDAIIFNKHLAHVERFKNELSARFKITTDKTLSRYLGIEITRTKHGFLLSQQRLIDSIYDKAKAYIDKYKVASMDVPIKFNRLKKAAAQPSPEEHLELKALPFRSLLGAVGYLMTSTMPSIAFAYKEISRFAADYRMEHFNALLELITYIKKHPTPLFIGVDGGDELTAYSDADWNNSKFHLSTTGFLVFHGNATQYCTLGGRVRIYLAFFLCTRTSIFAPAQSVHSTIVHSTECYVEG